MSSFWRDGGLVLTDGHTFQSDEKPPPGSQLLVTQQVSHICCFVLFASLKTGAHVVDFTEISYHCTPTKEVCVAYEWAQRNLRRHASGLRLHRVGLWRLWAALLWSCKDFTKSESVSTFLDKCLHSSSPFCTNRLPSIRVISWRRWSVVARSVAGSFRCRLAHWDWAWTLPSRRQELASTYLSFTAILANLIWGAVFKNRLMNYLFSLTERLAGRKCSGVGCVWLRRGLRIEKSLSGIVLHTGISSESVLFVPGVWLTAQNSNRLSMSWTFQQWALCSGDTDSSLMMMATA